MTAAMSRAERSATVRAVRRHARLIRRHPASAVVQMARVAPLRRASFRRTGPLADEDHARQSLFPDVDVSQAVDRLTVDGVFTGFQLSAETVEAIADTCSDPSVRAVLVGDESDARAACPGDRSDSRRSHAAPDGPPLSRRRPVPP